MLLTRSYARACRRDIGKILLSSRVGGSSLFSHSFDRTCPKPSTCLLHTTTVTAIYTSSSDNSEEKGKKIRQRKSKLKSANGDDDPVPTSENSKEQVKTETKKNANGPASLDSSASEETGKKRRIKSKLKKSVNGDDDPVPIATSNDKKTRTRKSRKRTDESTADLSKQKKKKKEKKSPDISDQELKDLLLGPFIPFEGTVKHINTADTKSLHDGSFSIDCQDSLEGRCYHIKSSAGHDMSTYSFPSVTTILQNTVEKGSYYRLLNWRRKLTAEHGMGGFDAIVKSTLKSGSNFHKVCA